MSLIAVVADRDPLTEPAESAEPTAGHAVLLRLEPAR
jgi:hypothetical protein